MSEPWWKQGVIYQIYPRSFQDGNGDGVGDLQGIIERLDYVRDLGAGAIWISPICPSPMADFGYDVADYTDIDPLFGDLPAFDRLVAAAHARDLKVILDYVPNHSSDQHPWFVESRSSRHNPKSDWYIWRDAKPGGGLPNNWLSCFGGPAWEWDDTRQQYYLHSFLKEQPDLDWRNPAVKQAMLDVIRFWMARGVDGLRMDVIFYLFKHPDLLDNPPAAPSDDPHKPIGEYDQQQHIYDMNWPDGRQALLAEIRRTLDEFPDRVGIGETYLMNPADIAPFYGEHLDGLHVPFNFTLLHVPWQAAAFHKAISRYYGVLPQGAWPNFVLGSHDEHRLATRYGPENARAAALLLFTLRGTPTWYYGDEIGMQDVPIPPGKEQDPWGLRVPELNVGRDPARTPMRWDGSPNAGFAPPGVETWLPVGDHAAAVNVAAQDGDPASHLNFVRALLRLRRDLVVLHGDGYFSFVDELPEDVLAYMRAHNGDRALVVINMGAQHHTLDLSALGVSGHILIGTTPARVGAVSLAALALRPHEGVLVRLN
jgi:alpha-glucosidase